MGWASSYIEQLQRGETVQFRPRGNSMAGKVENGALVTVAPLQEDQVLCSGNIVLCSVHGQQYLHLIKGVQKDRVLIGNNRGRINGWTPKQNVYGILTKVEP